MDQLNTLSKSEIERQQRAAAVRNRKIKNTALWAAILLCVVAGIYLFARWQKQIAENLPGETFADQGNLHISPGAQHDPYNSNPPTSGPHYGQPAPWGIYDEARPDEELVHNLEHGGVWISYKDPNDRALIEQLKDIADDYSLKVIMTSRPQNDSRIAVAAWTKLLKLEEFDEDLIRAFIQGYINKGPEQVPF